MQILIIIETEEDDAGLMNLTDYLVSNFGDDLLLEVENNRPKEKSND